MIRMRSVPARRVPDPQSLIPDPRTMSDPATIHRGGGAELAWRRGHGAAGHLGRPAPAFRPRGWSSPPAARSSISSVSSLRRRTRHAPVERPLVAQARTRGRCGAAARASAPTRRSCCRIHSPPHGCSGAQPFRADGATPRTCARRCCPARCARPDAQPAPGRLLPASDARARLRAADRSSPS